MEESAELHRNCDEVNGSTVVEYKQLILDANEKYMPKCLAAHNDHHQVEYQPSDLYKNSIKFSAALPQVNT